MKNYLLFPAFCFFLATSFSAVHAKGDFLLNQTGETSVVVSVPDQKLVVLHNGQRKGQYSVSTSKFGLGDRPRSYATPLGTLEVVAKVGDHAPAGSVFKGRRATGEVLRANARGRDPIVTRILHLRGTQASNSNAYGRGIYIHGTPEERRIGRPASYGCIRMKSRDVIRVFNAVPIGTKIEISAQSLNYAMAAYTVKHALRRPAALAAN